MRAMWQSAWTVLAGANFFWALNVVLARGISGDVPPITLAWVRWTGAFLFALPFAWRRLMHDLPVIRRHWAMMLLLAATGIASYNTMSYIGLTGTTALNLLLLQSSAPLIIIVWAFLIFRDVPTLRQAAGVLVSLAGVAAIAGHGSLQALASLTINPGDVWIVSGIAVYAVYCVMARKRPAVHPLSFLVAAMGIGSVQILPFAAWEWTRGVSFHGGWPVYLAMAYIAVLPSFVAYLLFNRGLELAGPGPAGQSMHLMPLFGSVLAVLLLHEQFRAYHAVGIMLIAAGILLASLSRLPMPRLARAPN
ncbi:MAG TPA: DMT family transporter [Rhodopila sp.]|uniref:DMT family transporter n=1 Tax=Rhodopila sp. TaxID=2480087 RepID=UPI002BE32E26|nr:DMT family transporter [Rhodopila sp.]HVY17849.1 DMT family transporter [Rhodopila sp.]